MKKLFILFASVVVVELASAQESFYKHALVISAGLGGDGYVITEKYTVANTLLSYTASFNVASSSYPFSVEYGIGKRIGIGIVGKVDNYHLKKDSVSGYQPTAIGFEYGVMVNYHFIRSGHLDFFAGLNLGASAFTWNMDTSNDQLYGKGGWGDIHATLRYYFGRFGLFASISFPTMNYTNLTTNNASLNTIMQYIPTTWEAKGATFHIGIQYRIFNPPGDK
jgi:hypothetical protein